MSTVHIFCIIQGHMLDWDSNAYAYYTADRTDRRERQSILVRTHPRKLFKGCDSGVARWRSSRVPIR